MMHAAILRELMIAGYEGASLVAAFERMCGIVALGGHAAGATPLKSDKAGRNPVDTTAAGISVAGEPTRTIRAPVAATLPPDNAKSIARKAIAQSMLSPSTIALASHLIERLNLSTGRCDPGSGSLADDLGISVRQVRRSVASLIASGLFGKARNGGRAFANGYQPNWPIIVDRAAEGDIVAKRPTLSADAAKAVTQNHLRKPDSDSMTGKARRAKRPAVPDRRQMSMVMSIKGGRSKAEEAVRARLNRELAAHLAEQHLPHDRPAYVAQMTASMSADWDAAIAGEMRRAGDGLRVIIDGVARATSNRRAMG